MEIILLSFITAFALTYFALPSIIRVAIAKNLYDEPGERSSHSERTPSLGGIGIFSGSIFSIILWTPFSQFANLQYILCAFIILFLIGAKDDIAPVSARNKLIAEIIASSILIGKSHIFLSSFHGLFYLYGPMPVWGSWLLTMLTMLLLINAFNLIDGINGLAGSMGILINGTLGCWFFMIGKYEFATVAFATAGSITAFLRYNFSPAKIFMGDTGALLIGMITAILIIEFIELDAGLPAGSPYRFEGAPVVGMGIVLMPVFDTLRVICTRLLRGQHPFKADRRHIHHLLIDYGFSHMQATGILVFANACAIVMVFSLHDLVDQHLLLLGILTITISLTYWLHKAVNKKNVARAQPAALSV